VTPSVAASGDINLSDATVSTYCILLAPDLDLVSEPLLTFHSFVVNSFGCILFIRLVKNLLFLVYSDPRGILHNSYTTKLCVLLR